MPAGHPGDEMLLDYSERGRDAHGAAATEAHLREGCPRCDRILEEYREVLRSLHARPLDAAPEELLRAAMQRIRALEDLRGRVGAAETVGSTARRAVEAVRLALVLDSRRSPVLQGIRAPADATARQILFESPLASLHLQIRRSRKRSFRVTGLFAPVDGTVDRATEIVLEGEQDDRGIARRRLSTSGEFLFPSVASGRLRVRVESPSFSFYADPLELEEDEDA